jgi:hypothetical protein
VPSPVFSADQTIFAIGSQRLGVSHDAGNSFVSVSLPAGRSAAGFEVVARSGTLRVLALLRPAASGADQLGYSDDMGATWIAAPPRDDLRFSALRSLAPHRLMTAIWRKSETPHYGFLCSNDDGGSWGGC